MRVSKGLKRADCSIRRMTPADSDAVLTWRNSDNVRKYMYDSSVISLENHAKWFATIIEGKLRTGYIFEYKNEPAGVVCANLRDPERNSHVWGCYLINPGAIAGLGTAMGLLAMEVLFEIQQVKVLIGEMIASNERSRKFNLNIGFKILSEDFKKAGNEDSKSVLFEQTLEEWLAQKPQLYAAVFDDIYI